MIDHHLRTDYSLVAGYDCTTQMFDNFFSHHNVLLTSTVTLYAPHADSFEILSAILSSVSKKGNNQFSITIFPSSGFSFLTTYPSGTLYVIVHRVSFYKFKKVLFLLFFTKHDSDWLIEILAFVTCFISCANKWKGYERSFDYQNDILLLEKKKKKKWIPVFWLLLKWKKCRGIFIMIPHNFGNNVGQSLTFAFIYREDWYDFVKDCWDLSSF